MTRAWSSVSARVPGAAAASPVERNRKESNEATRDPSAPIVRHLGRVAYRGTLNAMIAFTAERDGDTPDELWVLEHPPVYTVGVAGRVEHLPRRNDILLERVDRGGQITYHGPGQAVVYTLVDLVRRRLTVRGFVRLLEQAMIEDLAASDVAGERRPGAPGVYVQGAKIGALGVRIRRGRAYHGLAYNVAMDLSPFLAIDPCGYPGLVVTDLATLGIVDSAPAAGARLASRVATLLEHHGHEAR